MRISRGRIRRGSEAEAFGLLRDSVDGQSRPDGLEAFVIARQMIEGQLELVALTTWRDLDTMIAVMGHDWQTASWLPALAPLVESSSVEHLETIAESFHGLAGMDPAAIDLLAPTDPDRPPSV